MVLQNKIWNPLVENIFKFSFSVFVFHSSIVLKGLLGTKVMETVIQDIIYRFFRLKL